MKPTETAVINAAHLQGVSLMKLGLHKRAADVLQKTYSAMAGNRNLVFNVALCDVLDRTYAVRAAKNLQSYATNHPDDEQIVNLWGCAIDAAATEGKNPGKMNEFLAAYARVDTLLAATRPGFVRWGTAWMTKQEFAPIDAKRAQQKAKIETARSERDVAVAAYERAQAAYKRAAQPIKRTGTRTTHDWYHDNCIHCLERDRRNRMEEAEREIAYRRPIAEAAVAAFDAETAAMPKPSWVMSMEPLDPLE